MKVLTDEEIRKIQAANPTENDPMPFARAIEASVLEKLSSAEPVAKFDWNEGKFVWLTKYDYFLHHNRPLYLHPPAPVSAEPVAYMVQHDGKCMGFLPTREKNTVPVFTHPPAPSTVETERDEAIREIGNVARLYTKEIVKLQALCDQMGEALEHWNYTTLKYKYQYEATAIAQANAALAAWKDMK